MNDVFSPRFDHYVNQIKRWRQNEKEWEEIEYALKKTNEGLQNKLDTFHYEDCFPRISVDDWKKLVLSLKKAEFSQLALEEKKGSGIIIDDNLDNNLEPRELKNSMWKEYEKKLRNKGFSSMTIDGIKQSASRVLKRISDDTTKTGPIKGMVVGNVQSGKTANMAALMAMAADEGWNMFIILSGTIENLRKQTEQRIFDDLNLDSNLRMELLSNLSKKKVAMNQQLSELDFKNDSKLRYFCVCLKNLTRLQNLIQWLEVGGNDFSKMKILVIDDEADQASVNTSTMFNKPIEEINKERKKINKLIVKLITETGKKGKIGPVKAMNYICYTATPYANFLNEAWDESLYPANFINFINPSTEYFGPQEIFGVDGDDSFEALPIVRSVHDFEQKQLNQETYHLPKSLEESLYYFICAASAMRFLQKKKDKDGKPLVDKKPVSMLIQMSQKQKHHNNVQEAVSKFIKKCRLNINKSMEECEKIWNQETNKFTANMLVDSLKDYYDSTEEINNYPSFEEIKQYINELLSTENTNIMLDDEMDKTYHQGLHLCVDNCANNLKSTDEIHLRLAYPNFKKDDVCEAPAFIVIGGSTLSRGLTIEGLVTSYFVRPVKQADTLMQMGRWFGYRKGYELLPRIWMTVDAYEKFVFLSTLDFELRGELKRFQEGGQSPSEYGPFIKNTPKISWLSITARNKMQNAKEAEMDFSNYSKQTIIFKDDLETMQKNIRITEDFLQKIGSPKISFDNSSLVWRGVSFDKYISKFLSEYESPQQSRAFNDVDLLIKWISEVSKEKHFNDWNVVVAGNRKIDKVQNSPYWSICGHKVANINRAKIIDVTGVYGDLINIKVLRSPEHLVVDADLESNKMTKSEKEEFIRLKKEGTVTRERTRIMRRLAKVDNTPLLIIYRINKKYDYFNNRKDDVKATRENMNAKEDMIGICIVMGNGQKGNNVKKITINIPIDDDSEDLFDEN